MKFILAALASLGLLFSWAACVAVGLLEIGHGSEPMIYNVSLAVPAALILIGIVQEILFHFTWNRMFSSAK